MKRSIKSVLKIKEYAGSSVDCHRVTKRFTGKTLGNLLEPTDWFWVNEKDSYVTDEYGEKGVKGIPIPDGTKITLITADRMSSYVMVLSDWSAGRIEDQVIESVSFRGVVPVVIDKEMRRRLGSFGEWLYPINFSGESNKDEDEDEDEDEEVLINE